MLMATRWDSWFNVAKYHSSFGEFYERFFKQVKNHGLVVNWIQELIGDDWQHHASYHNLHLNLHFKNKNCTCLITALTSLQETKSAPVCIVYGGYKMVFAYWYVKINFWPSYLFAKQFLHSNRNNMYQFPIIIKLHFDYLYNLVHSLVFADLMDMPVKATWRVLGKTDILLELQGAVLPGSNPLQRG